MSAREDARRFLAQLRAEIDAALGILPTSIDPAAIKATSDRLRRESLTPEQAQDPEVLAILGQASPDIDAQFEKVFSRLQDNIEKTAAARIEGLDLGPLRPLVGHLRTGQLNALSMRVPGRSGAYLVVVEDEMPLFANKLSKAVAWALPKGPSDANGMSEFVISVSGVTDRIESDPEVADRFAEIVSCYAVTGRVSGAGHFMVPPGYLNFAAYLRNSLEYFVLGHEYAHILMGHLNTAAARKGALPAGEAEVLAYSWQQEFEADQLGMVLSLNTCVEQEGHEVFWGFSGIGLFFDALDVMDRAVALLQTGDENARQLGSHPPSDLRMRRLREFLPAMVDAERARVALDMAEVQGEIIRLLWERTRPRFLELHRRGVRAAHLWQTIPKETGHATEQRSGLG